MHRSSPTAHNIAIILKVAAIFAGHLNKGKRAAFVVFEIVTEILMAQFGLLPSSQVKRTPQDSIMNFLFEI